LDLSVIGFFEFVSRPRRAGAARPIRPVCRIIQETSAREDLAFLHLPARVTLFV
jgi:hypothetical protein